MPNLHHNLMGIGPLCDHGCRVLFEKTTVTVFPKTAPSSYMSDASPLEPSYKGSPSDPKIIQQCHKNGTLAQPRSLHMNYQVWDPWSATYMLPEPSQ